MPELQKPKMGVKRTFKKLLEKFKSPNLNRSFGANDDFQIRQMPIDGQNQLRETSYDLQDATRKWRAEIDEFCLRYDSTAVPIDGPKVPAKLGRTNKINKRRSTQATMCHEALENIRMQTRIYRDELYDLKCEAKSLKHERNQLIEEMERQGLGDEPIRKALVNPKRRKSISTPYRIIR